MSINPETEHLAGCPSCDVAPVVTESDGPWFVGCANPNCPLQCEVRGDTRSEAERLWNVRPAEARLRAQRDEEREAVVRYRGRVAALEVEVSRLRETLESHGPEGHNVTNEQFVALRMETQRLRAALREHGIHKVACEARRKTWPCTCGLQALLAGGGNG